MKKAILFLFAGFVGFCAQQWWSSFMLSKPSRVIANKISPCDTHTSPHFRILGEEVTDDSGGAAQAERDAQKASAPREKSVFSDIQSIMDEGVLRVAMLQADKPPFFFVNRANELAGLDVELAQLIAKSLGVKVEFVRTAESFNAVVDLVASGKAHIGISKLSYTESRAKKVLYSDPYLTLNLSLLINRSQLERFPSKISINKIFENHNVKVSTLQGSSQVVTIQKMFPNAEITQVESVDDVNNLVLQGECFARVSDNSELTKLLLLNPEFNIKCVIVAFQNEKDRLHMVVNADFAHLHEYVKTLAKNKKAFEIDLQSIFIKYEKELKG